MSTLSGPSAVTISVTLGIRGRAKPTVVDVALANIGDTSVTTDRITCDPVRLAQSGAAAAGFITAAPHGPDIGGDATLPPGGTINLALAFDAPRRAGTYASTLRVRTAPGGAVNIPIALQVGANPVWGVSAMLAGLMLLAVVNVLAGEADLRDELHKVLQFRQDANERLERNPPAESQADNLALLDANIRQAVQTLTMRRQWSIVDHRIEEARDRKRVAEDELKEIEESLATSPAGAAQVAELDREWARLRQKMAELSARASPAPEQSSGNFAGRVANLVGNLDKNLLDLPVQIDQAELGTHVELVDLALSAGRRDDANRSALEVRRWLQRDASDLENRLDAAARVGTVAGFLIAEEARARQRLADPSLTADTRQALAKELDAASSRLSPASPLSDLRDTYVKVLQVGLHVLKARSEAVVAQVEAAIQKAALETSLAPVQKAMADNPPTQGASREAKIVFLHRVLAAWNPLAAQADESTQNNMKGQIAAINALLDRGDLKPTAAIYHRLMEAWNDYGMNRINAAVRSASASYCQTAAADLRRDLANTEAEMELVPDHAQLPIWEPSLDRIRVQAAVIPMEGCLAGKVRRKEGSFASGITKTSALFDLAAQAADLRQQVFAADLVAVPISAQDRLEIAQNSGVQRAENLARSLLDKPRPLTVELTTREADRYAGRPVSFRIGGFDQSWGPGVLVAIDFGDGSVVAVISAEEARKQLFVHSYASPIATGVRVSMAIALLATSRKRTVGIGMASFRNRS